MKRSRNVESLRGDMLASQGHQQALGRVAVLSARVEIEIQTTIWALAGLDRNAGRAITTHIASRELIDVLVSLTRLRFSDADADGVLKICRRLKRVQKRRGEFIHALWSTSLTRAEDPIAQFRKHRGQDQFVERSISRKEIDHLGDRFRKIELDLVNFFHSRNVCVPLP